MKGPGETNYSKTIQLYFFVLFVLFVPFVPFVDK